MSKLLMKVLDSINCQMLIVQLQNRLNVLTNEISLLLVEKYTDVKISSFMNSIF